MPANTWQAFVCGFLLCPILAALALLLWSTSRKRDVYGLEHGVLNVRIPPESMFMNLGYWKSQLKDSSDFPEACLELLRQVVLAAFPYESEQQPRKSKIHLLDVGFGCGDQTLHLLSLDDPACQGGNSLLDVVKYVGITKNVAQFKYACQQLGHCGLLGETQERVEIFTADAGEPSQWSQQLQEAVLSLGKEDLMEGAPDVWMLGLDSLHHLEPSRLPLLKYTHRKLGASVMAFDLLLSNDPDMVPAARRLLLRLICWMMNTPYGNFITPQQYRRLLTTAGYLCDDIRITDISDFVFEPLARFMDKQDAFLGDIGLGLGRFRIAKWVFRWFASSGIVRGCIIVARNQRSGSPSVNS